MPNKSVTPSSNSNGDATQERSSLQQTISKIQLRNIKRQEDTKNFIKQLEQLKILREEESADPNKSYSGF